MPPLVQSQAYIRVRITVLSFKALVDLQQGKRTQLLGPVTRVELGLEARFDKQGIPALFRHETQRDRLVQ